MNGDNGTAMHACNSDYKPNWEGAKPIANDIQLLETNSA